jgi:lipoic acid synthetase
MQSKLNILPDNTDEEARGRFPSWLHRKLPKGGTFFKTNQILEKYQLNTVCEEAKCPNRFECYSKKTATFLALGKECTRNCGFCDIDFSKQPKGPAADEPARIAASSEELGLKHVVVTMVARDDLPDGGAAHMAEIVRAIREKTPGMAIELLTSDFSGNLSSLDTVLDAHPEVFNHNIETVERLSPRVRHKASYRQTLSILSHAAQSGKVEQIKSGLMVGLGESEEEVFATIRDLHAAGCTMITIGQYLQAGPRKLLVKEFVHPDQFKRYEEYGHALGVRRMFCGPFVRSSYHADALI